MRVTGKHLHVFYNLVIMNLYRPVRRLSKGGANLRVFTRGGENSDFEAEIRGVNSVSGEKLHDFEIICSARGVPPPPPMGLLY